MCALCGSRPARPRTGGQATTGDPPPGVNRNGESTGLSGPPEQEGKPAITALQRSTGYAGGGFKPTNVT
jgi:hypothetical protein